MRDFPVKLKNNCCLPSFFKVLSVDKPDMQKRSSVFWYLKCLQIFTLVPDTTHLLQTCLFLTLRHFQRKCIFGHKHLFLESFRKKPDGHGWVECVTVTKGLNHKRPWNLPVCAKKVWLWVYKNTAILSFLKQLQSTIVISLKV